MKKSRIKLNLNRTLFISAACVGLVACGGGSNSGGGQSQGQQYQANDCVEFEDGAVLNFCDFDIIVRTFAGSFTPVFVPANSAVDDPDANFSGQFGTCEAPFTPISTSDGGFDCL